MPHTTRVSLFILLSIMILFCGCIGEIEKNPLDDDTAPILLSHSPGNGATDQPRNLRIELNFDDQMLLDSCKNTKIFLSETTINSNILITNATAISNSRCLCLYPSQLLKANTSYQISIQNGPNNFSGLPFSGKSWQFATGDWTTNYQPTITISNPSNLRYCNSTFQANGSCDNIQYLYYSVNTLNDWQPIQISSSNSWQTPLLDVTTAPFIEGTNKLYIRAKRIHNEYEISTTNTILFIVDTVPPTVTITSPAANSILSNTITVQGSAQDNICLASIGYRFARPDIFFMPFTLLSNNLKNWSFTFDTRQQIDAITMIQIEATDKAGNRSIRAESTICVSNLQCHTFPHTPTDGEDSWDITISATDNNHKLFYSGNIYNFGGTLLASSGPAGERVKTVQDSSSGDIHILSWSTNSNNQKLSYARFAAAGGSFQNKQDQVISCNGAFALFSHNNTPYIFYTRTTPTSELPPGTTGPSHWDGCLYMATPTSSWNEQFVTIIGFPWGKMMSMSVANIGNHQLYLTLLHANEDYPSTTYGTIYILKITLSPLSTEIVHEELIELNPIQKNNQTAIRLNSSNMPIVYFVNNLQNSGHIGESKSKSIHYNGTSWNSTIFGIRKTTSISTCNANNSSFYSYRGTLDGETILFISDGIYNNYYGGIYFANPDNVSPHIKLRATTTGLKFATQIDGKIQVYSTAYPPTP